MTSGLEKDLGNSFNFHASDQKSRSLHFNALLLSKAYKDLEEKVQKIRVYDTEEWCKFWRKTESWFQKWYGEFSEFSPKH